MAYSRHAAPEINLHSGSGTTIKFPSRHITRNLLLIWLALLLVLPVAAYLLAGETEVVIGNQGGTVWAEVHGTRLDVPADGWDSSQASRLKLPDLSKLVVAPPSSSQYWQAAQPDISSAIGVVGEWLQLVRPPAQWTSAQIGGDGTAIYRLKVRCWQDGPALASRQVRG